MGCGCSGSTINSTVDSGNEDVCGGLVPASPCGNSCCTDSAPEDHCQKIYIEQFYTSLRTTQTWAIPDCGQTVVVPMFALKAIMLGANLWSPIYGYFEVVSFDVVAGTVTVKNNCLEGNSSVGTTVPECTEFVISPPPCCTADSPLTALFPYLAVDFVAPPASPDPSNCIAIELTTVGGLITGEDIAIGAGIYNLNSILDATHVIICNMGLGVIAGTTVYARNGVNEYQYPVIMINATPCNHLGVSQVTLLGCDSGVVRPLAGNAGEVPVCINSLTDAVEFQDIGIANIPTAAERARIPSVAQYASLLTSTQVDNIPTAFASWVVAAVDITLGVNSTAYWRQDGVKTIDVVLHLYGTITGALAAGFTISLPPGFLATALFNQVLTSNVLTSTPTPGVFAEVINTARVLAGENIIRINPPVSASWQTSTVLAALITGKIIVQ